MKAAGLITMPSPPLAVRSSHHATAAATWPSSCRSTDREEVALKRGSTRARRTGWVKRQCLGLLDVNFRSGPNAPPPPRGTDVDRVDHHPFPAPGGEVHPPRPGRRHLALVLQVDGQGVGCPEEGIHPGEAGELGHMPVMRLVAVNLPLSRNQ